MADLDKARTRSVGNLQRLYTVVVSLAVVETLRRLLGPCLSEIPEYPDYNSWLMFTGFLATVIPFYHGANRYLDATYVTGERKAKPAALMVDFIMLLLEGLGLVVLAMLVGKPDGFYTALAALFVFDAVWVGSTFLTSAEQDEKVPRYIKKWAIVNLVVAAAIIVSVWSKLFDCGLWRCLTARNIVLLGAVLGRSVYDYITVWEFYYPNGQDKAKGNIPAPPPAPPPA